MGENIMGKHFFTKDNLPRILLMAVTAVLITVTGITFRQSFIRILPLYVSLVVGILQSRANRYASLLGGLNSILYTLVYVYLGLYASAGYALLFSFPLQIITFILWSRRKRGESTKFRRLSWGQRGLVLAGYAACFTVLGFVLKAAGSNHQLLDNLTSLTGILISVLTMFAFVEYTWLMLPSGVLSIVLNFATMQTNPEQITYVIFSFYSIICVTVQFFRVRRLYAEQNAAERCKI
jgi:nicotinamide riboside transporter PnuC